MTLQDLRNFFDPKAPMINGIPTISNGILLNNTIDAPSPFKSDGLRALDSVLSNVKNLKSQYTYFTKYLHYYLYLSHISYYHMRQKRDIGTIFLGKC